MKIIVRVALALVLVFIATKILYPYYHFHLDHIENFLSGQWKISWLVSPIMVRIALGLLYVAAFLLLFYYEKIKWVKYVAPLVLVLPFIFNPIYPRDYKSFAEEIDQPLPQGIELDENKTYILAFFSPGCLFCKEGSKRLAAAQQKSDNFPEIFVASPNNEMELFFKNTETQFDFTAVGKDTFNFYTQSSFPKYYLVENGRLTKFYTPKSFNFKTLDALSK